jgi:hypothetical protein
MATRLDQQVGQLENIVEQHLDPCRVMCNGSRCILPRNHAKTEPHQFLFEFLEMLATAEHKRRLFHRFSLAPIGEPNQFERRVGEQTLFSRNQETGCTTNHKKQKGES